MKKKKLLIILFSILFPLCILIGISTWLIVSETIFTPKYDPNSVLAVYFADNQEVTYNGEEQLPSYKVLDDDGYFSPSLEDAEISYSYASKKNLSLYSEADFKSGAPTKADTYWINICVTLDEKEYQLYVTFTIKQVEIKVVFSDKDDVIYDGKQHTLDAPKTTIGGEEVDDYTEYFTYTIDSKTDADTYPLSATITLKDSNNYLITNDSKLEATLIINKKTVYLDNSAPYSLVYDSNAAHYWASLQSSFVGLVSVYNDENLSDINEDFTEKGAFTIDSINDGTFYFGKEVKGLQTDDNNVVGSTYYFNITLSDSLAKNYKIDDNNCIVKYKTVKVGSEYYTIEDALNTSGTTQINLVGDSSSANTYIITSFCNLDEDKYSYGTNSYTLTSKRTLYIPYTSTSTANYESSKTPTSSGNVCSVLFIPVGIEINLLSSSSFVASAFIGFSQPNSSITCNRAVVMNYGSIIAESGSYVYSYGYIKGTGQVILKNGANAVDVMHTYDWPGGSAARYSSSKKFFPTNAWSMHNISCFLKIYSGATFSAYLTVIAASQEADATVLIIGKSNSSNCLFLPSTINENTYIEKYAKNSSSYLSDSNLSSIKGSNQLKIQREQLNINGDYVDSTLDVSVSVYGYSISLNTSTSVGAPISYFDINLANNSSLELSNSDYTFLPGSSLTIESGATLTINSNVDLCFVPYSSLIIGNYIYNFDTYCVDKVDAYLINNGTVINNGNLGGLVKTTSDNSSIVENSQSNNTAEFRSMYTHNDPYVQSGSVKLKLYLFNGVSVNEEYTNVGVSNYYSKKSTTDNNYGWYATSGTISFYNTKTKDVIKNQPIEFTSDGSGYTIETSIFPDNPKKDFYTFTGWYVDESCTVSAEGYVIYSGLTLYSGWEAIQYNVIYENFYDSNCEFNTDSTISNNNVNKITYETNIVLSTPSNFKVIDDETIYLKFGVWFYYEEDSQHIISNLVGSELLDGNCPAFIDANDDGIKDTIYIYASWYSAKTTTYTITYVNSNSDVECKDYDEVIVKDGNKVDDYETPDLSSKNDDNTYSKVFVGWYLDSSFNTQFTDKSQITGDIDLYARWEDKVKIVLSFEEFAEITETYYLNINTKFTVPDITNYSIITIPDNKKFAWYVSSGSSLQGNYYSSGDKIDLKGNCSYGDEIDIVGVMYGIKTYLELSLTNSSYYSYTIIFTDSSTGNLTNITSYSSRVYIGELGFDSTISITITNKLQKTSSGLVTKYYYYGFTVSCNTINNDTISSNVSPYSGYTSYTTTAKSYTSGDLKISAPNSIREDKVISITITGSAN